LPSFWGLQGGIGEMFAGSTQMIHGHPLCEETL
jgi:hypothetical protein